MESKYDGTDQALDLSCFPLLRVDQLHLHTNNALQKSHEELSALVDGSTSNDQFKGYASRLINLIRKETAERRVYDLLALSDDNANDDGNHSLPTDSRKDEETICVRPLQVDSNDYGGTERNLHVRRDIPSHVPSYEKVAPRGFKARAKTRISAIKAQRIMDSDKYQNQLLEKDKLQRRKEAEERIHERRIRRAKIETRLERRRSEKQARGQAQKVKLEQLEIELEQVTSAAVQLVKAHNGNKTEAYINAATAATRVLEKADVDMLSSDSGSSLVSDVDTFVKPIESHNDSDDELHKETIGTEGFYVLRDSCARSCEEVSASEETKVVGTEQIPQHLSPKAYDSHGTGTSKHIMSNSYLTPIHGSQAQMKKPYLEKLNVLRDSCARLCEEVNASEETQVVGTGHITRHSCPEAYNPHGTGTSKHIMSNSYLTPIHGSQAQMKEPYLEKPNFVTSNTNKVHLVGDSQRERRIDGDVVEWTPWLEQKDIALSINPSSFFLDSGKCTYAFTDMFPTFNSIFTAFMSAGHYGVFDRNLQIERECLEYQIKVRSSLKQLECTSETASYPTNSLVFCTKSMRKEVASIISDVLLDQDDVAWSEVSESSAGNCWNLLWTWKKPKVNPEHLLVCQRISRFQNTSCLTRKDHLKKQLERTRSSISSRLQHKWNIMPLTYVLPNEFTAFLSAFSAIQKTCQEGQSNLWILKPSAMSRGRGITIVDDIGKVTYSSPTVIQQYLPNPLLFQGYKFDLRLYILVTSFSPLEAYIYKEGFARFGSRKFSSNKESINDFQIHLTNSSIQNCYIHDIKMDHPARAAGKDGGGNKVRITWLWSRLKEQGIDVQEIWNQTKDLCIKTLLSAEDEIPYQPNAFEVFGFDVIIDDAYKPWLIEVNACPALSRENDLDVAVKEALIMDTIKIVSPSVYNRDALAEICERRLFSKKRASSKSTSERDVLEQDFRRIFNDELPRQYGQDPSEATGFESLAPGALFEDLVRQKVSQTNSQARV